MRPADRPLANGGHRVASQISGADYYNLPAFSGYRNQRAQLLRMGQEIFEYKPQPEVKSTLVRRIGALTK